jgi:hypothetical protein
MALSWTQISSTRGGPGGRYVRQSYMATATDGSTLIKEVALLDQGLSKFETPPDQPGNKGCVVLAQAMCAIPAGGVSNVEAAWVLESSVTTGERVETLWSNTLTGGTGTGKLYLSISFIQEPSRIFPAGQPYDGNIRDITMSMAYTA